MPPPPIGFSPDPPARPGAIDSRWLGKRSKVKRLFSVNGYAPSFFEDPVTTEIFRGIVRRAAQEFGYFFGQ
ncbi:MAG: hypothetical protein L6282_11825 [Candidatus Methanoperedenaceae archaeon]|nr:hypothetical protein [Candidatus Methanoperedenaceae archaeon]